MHRRGFGQQTLVDTLLFPVAGLEVRAEHPQVDQCELTPDQPRQQRRKTLAGDRVHRQVERGEDRRLHQLERQRGRHREDFPLVGQVVTAVVIVRVDTDLLLTTEHQHRRPGNNQRPQRQQLFALQRVDRVIGLDRRQNREGIRFSVMQQGCAGHRQVGDPPGAAQVAEIDHPLQLPVPLRIATPDHVVIGDIQMDGLDRQLVHQRLQSLRGLGRRLADERLLLRIADHWQQVFDQRIGMSGVPLQGALQARVLEVRQGPVHLPTEAAQADHQFAAEMFEMGQRLTLDVFQ